MRPSVLIQESPEGGVELTVPESTNSRLLPNSSELASWLRFAQARGSFAVADLSTAAAKAAGPGDLADESKDGARGSCTEMRRECAAARALLTAAAVELVARIT